MTARSLKALAGTRSRPACLIHEGVLRGRAEEAERGKLVQERKDQGQVWVSPDRLDFLQQLLCFTEIKEEYALTALFYFIICF